MSYRADKQAIGTDRHTQRQATTITESLNWPRAKVLKDYNKDRDVKIYVNDDLTKYRSQLFKTVRKLQSRKLFKQVCIQRQHKGNHATMWS